MTNFWEADVVVVGAGLAGLTAATMLVQSGFRVLTLEAGDDENYMCNSRIASGSLNLAQRDPTLDPSVLFQAITDEMRGEVDAAVARTVANSIGPALAWFRAEGAKLIKIARPGRRSFNWSLAPPRPAAPGFGWSGRGPDLALRALLKDFLGRGGNIIYGARSRKILLANERIEGVVAERQGSELEARAPCVLLADGGFQANPALVKRFISPKPDALRPRNATTGRGDALIMAENVGAQLAGTGEFYGHLLAQEALVDDRLWPYPTLDTLASGSIVVDGGGRRFLDEGIGGVAIANRIARLDDPLCAAVVFDEAIWETVGRRDFTPPNPYVVTCGGAVVAAQTPRDLAERLGIAADVLSDTIASYNHAVQSGSFSGLAPARTPGRQFGALKEPMEPIAPQPLVQPPFRAIRLCAGLTYTMGGIRIDSEARVLDEACRAIPGLFAAGSCTGGVEGGSAVGYLGGLCKALALGYVAAQAIAQNHGAMKTR